jgi:hypothetical protein
MYRSNAFEISGTLEELRRLIGCLPEEITRCASELKQTGAANVRFGNGVVSILSRRREKELSNKERNKLYVAKSRCKTDVRQKLDDKSKSKNKIKEKEEERESESLSLTHTTEEPSLLAFASIFPDFIPSIFLQDTITSRITDLPTWRKTLLFWKQNNYRPQSVGKMCDKYDELIKERQNGTRKFSTKRTDADVFAESADFYANYPDTIA